MKRFPLFFVLLSVLLTSCRESYLAEKAFYQAGKTLQKTNVIGTESITNENLEPAIAAFEQVVEKYPSSSKAAESLFIISGLRRKQNDFEGARSVLSKAIPDFTGRGELASEARFQIAQLYEKEERWKEAEKAYWETAEYHPIQRKGLYAPLYVISHYKRLKDTVGQNEAYQKAVEHYERTLDQMGPIEVSAALKNSLALAYWSQGDWQKARMEWLSITGEFPKSPYAPLGLLMAAELSWKHKDYEQSFLNYGQFFERYPRHPLAGKTAVHVGLLHQNRKEFATGREWFQKAISDYFQKEPSSISDIKLLIGKSYQDEGMLEEAQKVYRELETNHPMTPAALQVPFMWFLHYSETGELERANQVLDEAIERYKKLVEDEPNSKVSGYAKKFMLSAYTYKKDWDQLMANVDRELQNETLKERKGRWLFLKALIAENRLQDRERALALYQDFLTQFPAHPLSQMAKSHQEILSRT